MVKVPEGELKAPEIRRMIKAHNKLMGIEIPKGTDRAGLIKLVEKNGYKVDHKAKKLVPSVKMKRKPTVKLPPEPAKKTKEEKETAKKERVIKKKAKDEEAYQKVKGQVDAVKKIGEKRKARLEKVPKGSHRMPDGTIMKDKDMKKPPKVKEMSTQTDEPKKMSDKELMEAFGYYKVGKLNEILDSLEGTSRAGGGSKLSKLKKIVKFGGLKKLKKSDA